MKKAKACLVLYGLFLHLCPAQEVISSQGGTYSNSDATMDFTIGETLIDSYSNNALTFNQGFLQPVTDETITSLAVSNALDQISIYPNPTSDILKLDLEHYDGLSYRIHDLTGRLIQFSHLENQLTEINVIDLKEGTYQLSIIDFHKKHIYGHLILKK